MPTSVADVDPASCHWATFIARFLTQICEFQSEKRRLT
jgi:hypothetical protein